MSSPLNLPSITQIVDPATRATFNSLLAALNLSGSTSGGPLVDLGTGVSGILPIANGGTDTSTQFTQGDVVFAGASAYQGTIDFSWDDSSKKLLLKNGLSILGSSSGSSTFSAAASGNTIVYSLPTSDGSNTNVLMTDGAGHLSWTTAGGGGGSGIQSINGSTAGAQTIAAGSNIGIVDSGGQVASGTYTSGIVVVGTAGQTINLAFNIDGGGSSATATVALTGLNTIAGGTALVITNAGSNYTSAPTSATGSSGTATYVSGTATVATVLNTNWIHTVSISGVIPVANISAASDTQVLFRDGTAVAGSSKFVFDKTSGALTLVSATAGPILHTINSTDASSGSYSALQFGTGGSGFTFAALNAADGGTGRIASTMGGGLYLYGTSAAPLGIGTNVGVDPVNNSQIIVSSAGAVQVKPSSGQVFNVVASELYMLLSQNAFDTLRIENTNTGTGAGSVVDIYSDTARIFFATHSSTRTLVRYGITLGGWAEMSAFSNAASLQGMVIGTSPAVPLVFGANNVEVMRLTSSSNVRVKAGSHINFGTSEGDADPAYGFKDNAGVMQYKNSGGSWASFAAGTGTVTHTAGNLTLNNFVLGNGGADVKDAGYGASNFVDVSSAQNPIAGLKAWTGRQVWGGLMGQQTTQTHPGSTLLNAYDNIPFSTVNTFNPDDATLWLLASVYAGSTYVGTTANAPADGRHMPGIVGSGEMNSPGNTYPWVIGVEGRVLNTAGTITEVNCGLFGGGSTNLGTVTTWISLKAGAPSTVGTITDYIGLYVERPTGGTISNISTCIKLGQAALDGDQGLLSRQTLGQLVTIDMASVGTGGVGSSANQWGMTITGKVKTAGSAVAYEKAGLLTWMEAFDNQTDAGHEVSVVGVDGRAYIGTNATYGSNTAGQVKGLLGVAGITPRTSNAGSQASAPDGGVVGLEIELNTYNSLPTQSGNADPFDPKAKVGIAIYNNPNNGSGTYDAINDAATAILIGKWQNPSHPEYLDNKRFWYGIHINDINTSGHPIHVTDWAGGGNRAVMVDNNGDFYV